MSELDRLLPGGGARRAGYGGNGRGRGQPGRSGTKTTDRAKKQAKDAQKFIKDVEAEAKASGVPKPVAAIFIRPGTGPTARKQFEELPSIGKNVYLGAVKREIKEDPQILPSKLHRKAMNETIIQMKPLPPGPQRVVKKGFGIKRIPKEGGGAKPKKAGGGAKPAPKAAQPASKTKRK
ncbi:MAG: hypothetical protein ACR2M9_03370 [Cyanophyceae cyanobacterium]